ncbi:MAG: OmpA family protein [Clostridiales bacterium]|jgi:chemotaxis protein MotB|nr:OmpA family protein [Clostridiales bacterium]
MAKRRKKHEGHEEGEAWLLPYSDLMTLLLAVFIVLFAVSKVDEDKAKAISDSFRGLTGNTVLIDGGAGIMEGDGNKPDQQPGVPTEAPAPTEPNPSDDPERVDLEKMKGELDRYMEEAGLSGSVTTRLDERGLVISLSDSILFDAASAEVKRDYIVTLLKIGEIIKPLDSYIRVEGHTDNAPISTLRYPSNWELSGARAASVVKLFIGSSGINPDRLSVVGYGESRPVADNASNEGRARNRRVDIILLSVRYNSLEEQQS